MTILNRGLSEKLCNLQRCSEMAPEGTYIFAKRAAQAVDESIEMVRSIIREAGFVANGTDHCRNLEVAIYAFLRASNPQSESEFIVSEGFGEHVDGPAGRRVMEGAIADRDCLRSLGVIS